MRPRLRPVEVVADTGPAMPLELLLAEPASGDHTAWLARRDAWLRHHGIDLSDYFTVQELMQQSRRHHGIPGALDRQWSRSVGANTWLAVVSQRSARVG